MPYTAHTHQNIRCITTVNVCVFQMQAIFTDETAVEHVKKQGPYRPKKPKMALMSEVFGRGK